MKENLTPPNETGDLIVTIETEEPVVQTFALVELRNNKAVIHEIAHQIVAALLADKVADAQEPTN